LANSRDVQLAGFAPSQTLHRQDAFRRQGRNAPGINQALIAVKYGGRALADYF
jgi:hypothetical protein